MSLLNGQTSGPKSEFDDLKEGAREQLLAELIEAIAPVGPPDDAFTVEEMATAMNKTVTQIYEYLKVARKDGKIENCGRFGKVFYYRKVKE